jgi:hypothetical protein
MEIKASRQTSLTLIFLIVTGLLTACVVPSPIQPTQPFTATNAVTDAATSIAIIAQALTQAAPTLAPTLQPSPTSLPASATPVPLTAAAPASPIPTGGQPNSPAPTTASNPTVAPSTGVTAIPSATPLAPPSALFWDTSPQALVIRASYDCCEMAPYDGNVYIPEAQVWGDGRIIWTSPSGAGGRTVFTGQLSHDQLNALLQSFLDKGFFTWQDNYQNYIGAALRPSHLTVNVSGASKTVTELAGAPDAYYVLADFLKQGAGASPSPYTPTRGYLTVRLFDTDPTNFPQWPADAAGFTLDQVGAGRYVEGEPLAFAWTQVNKGPNAPVYVSSNGQLYVIMIQIPGVSLNPPP